MRIQSSHLKLEGSMVETNCFTNLLEASSQKNTLQHAVRFRVPRARALARAIKCACRVAI
eukprot:3003295-Pyramimonas_sp.AAC.1